MYQANKWAAMLVVVALTACNDGPKTDVAAEREALMETSRQWAKQAAARNVDSIVQYWSDNALVLSAGEQPAEGKEAIRNMVASSFGNPGFTISWEPEKAEISESGDMGYLLENSQIQITDSLGQQQTMHFKTVTVWKKQPDGKWKAVVDVMSPLPPGR